MLICMIRKIVGPHGNITNNGKSVCHYHKLAAGLKRFPLLEMFEAYRTKGVFKVNKNKFYLGAVYFLQNLGGGLFS